MFLGGGKDSIFKLKRDYYFSSLLYDFFLGFFFPQFSFHFL